MEEVDKGCPMIRMSVSGCVFLLVPAHRVVLDKGPLNVCVCLFVCLDTNYICLCCFVV